MNDYEETSILDKIREKEFKYLKDHVYLDYTGSALYSEYQINKHSQILKNNVYGNPHSENLTSKLSTKKIEEARLSVLKFFNADPEIYSVIWTPNATGAIKLVGENYPFDEDSRLLLTSDVHNSCNGCKRYAEKKRSKIRYIPLDKELRLYNTKAYLNRKLIGNNLFMFPAQCNLSGVKHPLSLIDYASRRGWDVFLDASCYIPTSYLDLAIYKPDYVSVSFYKIFGYPTGVGALIAKKTSLEKLDRVYFGGGTVGAVSLKGDLVFRAPNPAGLEDGTVNFLNILAVPIGLKFISNIGYDIISKRVYFLIDYIFKRMMTYKHQNGVMLVKIYGPLTMEDRGGIIAFNLRDKNGVLIKHIKVLEEANKYNISLRDGCMCCPGGVEAKLNSETILKCSFQNTSKKYVDCLEKSCGNYGVVRVSVGLVSNLEDIKTFLYFIKKFLS